MHRVNATGRLALAFLLAAFLGQSVWGQVPFQFGSAVPDEQLRFTVTGPSEPKEARPGASIDAVIAFKCAPRHYIYRDSISVRLKGAEAGGPPITVGALSLPEAKSKQDKFLEKEVQYFDGDFSVRVPLQVGEGALAGSYRVTLEVTYQGCGAERCYLPRTTEIELPVTVVAGAAVEPARPAPAAQEPAVQSGFQEQFRARGIVGAILLAFLGGIGLSLTPCVYPLIPITISVVGAASGKSKLAGLRNSLVYVLGISLTYSVLGVAAASSGEVLGAWTQHPAVYLFLAAVFVLVAGAMLNLYVLQIPSSWAQTWQTKLRGRGGVAGVFVVGLLSGLVATPCIAPVLFGLMAYIFQTGNRLKGFLMFFVLAWGMGVPLLVLGTFTGLLESLPRSGAWMEAVKRFFAVCFLGLAIYFVGKSGIVPAFWYRALVAAFLATTSVFVGAFDSLDARSGWLERAKKALGLLLLACAIGVLVAPALSVRQQAVPEAGIQWIDSEQRGLALAGEQGKPVMMDFWAEWCAPCLKMDAVTFRDARVVQESARFVCVKIDGTDPNSEEINRLTRKYNLWGFPFIVFISSDGEVLSDLSIAEYVGAEELLSRMKAVR